MSRGLEGKYLVQSTCVGTVVSYRSSSLQRALLHALQGRETDSGFLELGVKGESISLGYLPEQAKMAHNPVVILLFYPCGHMTIHTAHSRCPAPASLEAEE